MRSIIGFHQSLVIIWFVLEPWKVDHSIKNNSINVDTIIITIKIVDSIPNSYKL